MTTFLETADIETSSDDYARRFSGAVGEWFLQLQQEITRNMLTPYPPGSTILDVGGGHGQVADALIKAGYLLTVLGSDPICARRIQSYIIRGECQFEVGDILQLPFPDRAFDVVISYRLLPHVERWQVFLGELARVSRKAVILDYPETRSINQFAPYLFPFKKKMEGNTRPFTCFERAQLRQHFANYSFTLASQYAQFFFPMVLHRQLKSPRLSAFLENIVRRIGLTSRLGTPVVIKFVRAG